MGMDILQLTEVPVTGTGTGNTRLTLARSNKLTSEINT